MNAPVKLFDTWEALHRSPAIGALRKKFPKISSSSDENIFYYWEVLNNIGLNDSEKFRDYIEGEEVDPAYLEKISNRLKIPLAEMFPPEIYPWLYDEKLRKERSHLIDIQRRLIYADVRHSLVETRIYVPEMENEGESTVDRSNEMGKRWSSLHKEGEKAQNSRQYLCACIKYVRSVIKHAKIIVADAREIEDALLYTLCEAAQLDFPGVSGRLSKEAQRLKQELEQKELSLSDVQVVPDDRSLVVEHTDESQVFVSEEHPGQMDIAEDVRTDEYYRFLADVRESLQRDMRKLLDSRQRKIVSMSMGFAEETYGQEISHKDIADFFTVSSGRIGQIEQHSLRKLRDNETVTKTLLEERKQK